jgi:beta-phosphoglucomutase-like phosphatase (HAD superfamily)
MFDVNGTLSHEEPILAQILVDLFRRHGRPSSVAALARRRSVE